VLLSVTTSPGLGFACCRRYVPTLWISSWRVNARYAMTRYIALLAGSRSSLAMFGVCMGSPFVKLSGVGTINVAERAARLYGARCLDINNVGQGV
jgi:hypothetical protein